MARDHYRRLAAVSTPREAAPQDTPREPVAWEGESLERLIGEHEAKAQGFRDVEYYPEAALHERTVDALIELRDRSLYAGSAPPERAEREGRERELERERDAAVREAARRDQKWMEGINQIAGMELEYDPLGREPGKPWRPTLEEFVDDLRKRALAALAPEQEHAGENQRHET